MQNRKELLKGLKVCRFCLSQNEPLNNIYDSSKGFGTKSSISLGQKILTCLLVEVFPSDKMPLYICNRCKSFMGLFYDFKQLCRKADERILQYIQDGSALESIVWPPMLVTAFNYIAPKMAGLQKTLKMDGGATIHVTSHKISDSEDGNENLIVKIGDGSAKGAECIKVIQAGDKLEISKEKTRKDSPVADKPFTCKYCNKGFIKSSYYSKHLRLCEVANEPYSDCFPCDQCEDTFSTEDELIYHSAIHATQSLICPICQEKFEDVDAVTNHVKLHLNGDEFVCDLCELIFTSKEKLDKHQADEHGDVIDIKEEESFPEEIDGEDDTSDKHFSQEGAVLVDPQNKEITLTNMKVTDEEEDINANEEFEMEAKCVDMIGEDPLAITHSKTSKFVKSNTIKNISATITKTTATKPLDEKAPSILRKAEEIKRKALSMPDTTPAKKIVKGDTGVGGKVGDKSLRLLEKELQELKRQVMPRSNMCTPVKAFENTSKIKRIVSSTPKAKPIAEEKKNSKIQITIDRKQDRKAITKENKEPKEKESQSQEPSKNATKNGNADKSSLDDASIRRSARPSKVKDYAKINSPAIEDSESDDGDEEYVENTSTEQNRRGRRSNNKPVPKTPMVEKSSDKATPGGAKKRGRPPKKLKESPEKQAKLEPEMEPEVVQPNTESEEEELIGFPTDKGESSKAEKKGDNETKKYADAQSPSKVEQKTPDVLVSPTTGQTLKKVPVKSLPPGIKPLPLPVNARPVTASEPYEMQIGKRMVKVQKIVMTKAEVEAMAKKGLVEMKDGTMVLKQGIKLATSTNKDASSTEGKAIESPTKLQKAAPTRCDLDEPSTIYE